MFIYIVRRPSSDSPDNVETDCFTDPALAEDWAALIGETVMTEETIDANTLAAMKRAEGET